MKNIPIYIVALLLLLSTPVANSKTLKIVKPEKMGMSSEKLANADRVVGEAIDEGKIPGAVLAVVRGGSLVYLKAYGNRSVAPTTLPMEANTIFDIASCTKPVVTAISAMILVEQGRLSLRDDLDLYIPHFNDLRECDTIRHSIRIRHLMTHSSGLNPYVIPEDLEKRYGSTSRDSLVEYIRHTKRRYEPGTQFNYSCLNYILLQHIIEQVSGESLQSFAKRNIFDLLGMDDSDYRSVESQSLSLAASRFAPTEVISGDSVLYGVVHDPLARIVNEGVSGNAGLFSTAHDLALLSTALLGDGGYSESRLLSPVTIRAMRSVPRDMESVGRSLGWDVHSPYTSNLGDLFSDSAYGHTGFTGTSMSLDPENDIAVILLTNIVHLDDYKMIDILRLRGRIANIAAGSITSDRGRY
ncbi:MAG: serine hydrolase domain-containing protein [Rikenellaceae bacterium]